MVNSLRILPLLLLVFLQAKSQFQVSNYYPQSAAYQDTVFIVGSGFGTDATDLNIKLGQGNAELISVQDKLMKILVPGDATFGPLTVTKLSSHLTHYESSPFLPVYTSDAFDISHVDESISIVNEESGLYDLCNCDFDLDGDQDIATVNNSEAAKLTSVNVFGNATTDPGVPNFVKVPGTYFNISQPARNVTCGDLNGDGRPELIVSQGGDVAENIYIFKNMSSLDPAIINFSNPTILSTSNGGQTNGTRRLTIQDLNGDQLPEIVVSNQTAQQVIVFKNNSSNGNLSFPSDSRLYLPVPGNTLGLAVSDMDGDGLADIVTSENLGGNFYVLKNESSLSSLQFAEAQTFNLSGRLVNLACGDIDGNGRQDLVITDFDDGAILLMLNQSNSGSLAFASPIRMNAAFQPWGIKLADITGNQKADIIVATQAEGDNVVILKNNSTPGDPNFELIPAGLSKRYRNLDVADFNNDAKTDIIATAQDAFGNFNVSLIQNKTCINAEISPDDPSAICEGNPVLLTATAAKNVSYQWFRDGIAIGGANQITYSASTTGDYTVTITDNDIGCNSTSEVVSVVEDTGTIPQVPEIVAPTSVCEGETLNLSAANDATLSYYWSGPSGFESTEINPSILEVTPANSGVYQLEVKQGLCKSAVQRFFVEVVSNQEIQLLTSTSPVLCPGEEITMSFDASSYTNIRWIKDGQVISGSSSSTFTTTEPGTYQVSAQNTSSCENTSNELHISYLPLEASFSVDNANACERTEVTFSSLSTIPENANASYAWDFGDGNTSTEANPVHQYQQAGNYSVTLLVSLNEGSCSSTVNQTLNIVSQPTAEFIQSADFLCPQDTLQVELIGDFSAVTWEDGSQESTRLISEAGSYSAIVTNEQGCDSTYMLEISEVAPPQLFVEADGNTTLAVGDSVQLFATGADFYAWSPGTGLSDSTIANPFAKPLRTTTYTVTAYSESGCSITQDITINVDQSKIPIDALNIFSPNGDGIEDTWVISNFEDFPDCQFVIFDLHGREVYRSQVPYGNDWAGNDNSGNPLPEGAYYYVFRCGGEDNKASGNVNIVR